MAEHSIQAPTTLDQDTGRALQVAMRKLRLAKGDVVVLDLSPTQSIDSPGAAWLIDLVRYAHKRHATFRYEGEQGRVADFLSIIRPSLTALPSSGKREEGVFEELGGRIIKWTGEIEEFLELCFDAVYWTFVAPLEGRGFRWGLLIDEIHEMGVRAVRIVCLMNFLLGLIIAMLSSAQVASFGLSIYVADLIMIGFARELAAIMTSTVVSARTGAAIAAELATMKVQEEVDALRGMGLNVSQFLVAPKMLALLLVLPCLVVLGLISGILGGFFWGVLVLGFRPSIWWTQTLNAADLSDLMQGMLKTFVFAVFIVLIGCHNGLRVTGGSRGVGLMTTRSVVMDVFMLICVDIIFAAIFYYAIPA